MLKNYTSKSSLLNIFNEIERILIKHGAKKIVREYDDGLITSISFQIETQKGYLMIRLPARFDRVEQIFKNEGYNYKQGQPYRTAWATIRDWISAQMALLDWDMVKLEEIFLPYMVLQVNGTTIFEEMEKRQYRLPSGENNE